MRTVQGSAVVRVTVKWADENHEYRAGSQRAAWQGKRSSGRLAPDTGAALVDSGTAVAGGPAGELTLEKLLEVWNTIRSPLYYATTDKIERGQALLCENPELLVCHPDDLDSLRGRICHRRLVHVRNRPPGQFSLSPFGVGGRSG